MSNNSPNESGLRVKDRRMFTADGTLRDEYREILNRPPAPVVAEPTPAPSAPSPEPAKPPAPTLSTNASFQDLVGLLAQSASVYLSHALQAPIQQRAEHLELAKLHIDLLSILKHRTTGNLETLEQSMLDDVIYRLRLAIVDKG